MRNVFVSACVFQCFVISEIYFGPCNILNPGVFCVIPWPQVKVSSISKGVCELWPSSSVQVIRRYLRMTQTGHLCFLVISADTFRSQSPLCQSVPDIREQFPMTMAGMWIWNENVSELPWIRRVIYYLYFILYLDWKGPPGLKNASLLCGAIMWHSIYFTTCTSSLQNCCWKAISLSPD